MNKGHLKPQIYLKKKSFFDHKGAIAAYYIKFLLGLVLEVRSLALAILKNKFKAKAVISIIKRH